MHENKCMYFDHSEIGIRYFQTMEKYRNQIMIDKSEYKN